MIAHAMAVRLQAEGHEVEFVALLDSYPGDSVAPADEDEGAALADMLAASGLAPDRLGAPPNATVDEIVAALDTGRVLSPARLRRLRAAAEASRVAMRAHRPGVYRGTVLHVAAEVSARSRDGRLWGPYVDGRIDTASLPTTHAAMCSPPMLPLLGGILARHGL